MAEASDGAFDPTVGRAMEMHGFNLNYLSDQRGDSCQAGADVSYKDLILAEDGSAITLRRPMLLDLGAVARGWPWTWLQRGWRRSVTLRSVRVATSIAVASTNKACDGAWALRIVRPDELSDVLRVRDKAVCTSGDYERGLPSGVGHLIVAGGSGPSSDRLARLHRCRGLGNAGRRAFDNGLCTWHGRSWFSAAGGPGR